LLKKLGLTQYYKGQHIFRIYITSLIVIKDLNVNIDKDEGIIRPRNVVMVLYIYIYI